MHVPAQSTSRADACHRLSSGRDAAAESPAKCVLRTTLLRHRCWPPPLSTGRHERAEGRRQRQVCGASRSRQISARSRSSRRGRAEVASFWSAIVLVCNCCNCEKLPRAKCYIAPENAPFKKGRRTVGVLRRTPPQVTRRTGGPPLNARAPTMPKKETLADYASSGDDAMCRSKIEQGADPNDPAQFRYNAPPLYWATTGHNEAVARLAHDW